METAGLGILDPVKGPVEKEGRPQMVSKACCASQAKGRQWSVDARKRLYDMNWSDSKTASAAKQKAVKSTRFTVVRSERRKEHNTQCVKKV